MKTFLLLFMVSLTLTVSAQTRKPFFPVWTFHHENAEIYGLSLGFASGSNEPKNVVTHGVRVELIGLGLMLLALKYDPIVKDSVDFRDAMEAPLSETVNGIALSLTGTSCDCRINGVTVGAVVQLLREVNGVSLSAANLAQSHRGVQLGALSSANYRMVGLQAGFFVNESVHARGVQIGMFNEAKDLRGIQIGLWNKNGKRSLPLINWQFRKSNKIQNA